MSRKGDFWDDAKSNGEGSGWAACSWLLTWSWGGLAMVGSLLVEGYCGDERELCAIAWGQRSWRWGGWQGEVAMATCCSIQGRN